MEKKTNVGGYDRLVRTALAVILSVISVDAFRKGKRKTGLLAGIGALSFGFNATTQYCGFNDLLDRDTTADGAARTDAAALTDTGFTMDGESEATSDIDTAEDESDTDDSLTCASCGNPIRLGEPRGPNEHDEIVHVECATTTQR